MKAVSVFTDFVPEIKEGHSHPKDYSISKGSKLMKAKEHGEKSKFDSSAMANSGLTERKEL